MRTIALAIALLAGCATQSAPTSQPIPHPAPDPRPNDLASRSKAHNLMDSPNKDWMEHINRMQEIAGIK